MKFLRLCFDNINILYQAIHKTWGVEGSQYRIYMKTGSSLRSAKSKPQELRYSGAVALT
mgnify:CR=1 FL=1